MVVASELVRNLRLINVAHKNFNLAAFFATTSLNNGYSSSSSSSLLLSPSPPSLSLSSSSSLTISEKHFPYYNKFL
ncbi:unnamed protein product [Rhizophagus irregularis]|nr:unnamed protein product [Rhizophagus irregularis]